MKVKKLKNLTYESKKVKTNNFSEITNVTH